MIYLTDVNALFVIAVKRIGRIWHGLEISGPCIGISAVGRAELRRVIYYDAE